MRPRPSNELTHAADRFVRMMRRLPDLALHAAGDVLGPKHAVELRPKDVLTLARHRPEYFAGPAAALRGLAIEHFVAEGWTRDDATVAVAMGLWPDEEELDELLYVALDRSFLECAWPPTSPEED